MDIQLIKKSIYAAIVVTIVGLVIFYAGDRHGRVNERLAQNSIAITKSDSSTKAISIRVDSGKLISNRLAATRKGIRDSVQIKHDTINILGSVPIVSKEIAALIQVDDSVINAQANTISLQDTLIASLKIGLSLRDERIRLLSGPKHFSTGLQLGAGYCRNVTGGTPCLYVGYGVSFR